MTQKYGCGSLVNEKDQSYHSQWLWFSGDWFRKIFRVKKSKMALLFHSKHFFERQYQNNEERKTLARMIHMTHLHITDSGQWKKEKNLIRIQIF